MTDPSLPDGNKQENSPNDSTTMDQREAHSNPSRGSLPGGVLDETATFPRDRDFAMLDGPISSTSLHHNSNAPIRPTDHDTHQRSYGLDHVLHSASPTQEEAQQVISESQTSGSQQDQLSTSGQTPPLLASDIENETTDDVFPVSTVTNAAGQSIFSSQIGTASYFAEEGGSMASASLTHPTHGSAAPIYSEAVYPFIESIEGDDEEMDFISGEQALQYDYGYYDDEEIPAYRGSLIEDSELSRFSDDRLPRVSSVLGSTGSVCDDSCSEMNDTEKFYITDDELSWCDPTEYSNTRFTFGSDLHDSGSHQDQAQTFAAGRRSQPLSFTNHDNINGTTFLFNPDLDDDDGLELGAFPQPESMDSHFINPPSTLFLPLNIQALGKAQQIIRRALHNMKSFEYSSGPLMNQPRELYPNANSIMLQAVTNFFCQFSIFATPSKGIFLFRDTHHALFVNDTTITFLSGLEMTDSFLKSHDHTRDSPHFVFCQSLPWPRTSPAPQATPPNQRMAAVTPRGGLLTAEQYIYIHGPSEESIYFVPPSLILKYFNSRIARVLLAAPLAPCEGHTYTLADGLEFPAFEKNLSIDMFIKQWLIRCKIPPQQLALKERPHVPISDAAANASYWPRPQKITRPENHQFKSYDIQKIPWQKKMNVRRSDARMLRDNWYKGYRNLVFNPHGYSKRLPQTEEFFKAKTMYTKYKASMSHFQLRNLMSVTSSNTVQYANRSKIYSVTPFHEQKHCLIDLSNTSESSTFFEPVKISIMKAKYGVTVVGGFSGEYAMRGDVTDHNTVDGYLTKSPNGITNHIDIVKHRTSRSPQAIIASNDQYIRVLDCETNKFVQRHKFARAINCTDTSLDGRLRVIVGDAREGWIIDSESGKPVQPLSGHQDFGFACAWSPDMLHVATSNQDGTVNIWDARMWRILQFIESDVAGYRSLRYSPVGGGPRTLLMCEPADRIAIVNAQTYQTRQVHDFFGEIGGADYTPDGGRIWVANMDYTFGGLMEFDRCQWGQEFGIGRTRKRYIEERLDTYYPDLPNEWLPEADLDDDERCVLGPGERKLRFRRLMSNQEHADFLRI
ncbi:hypothetical protein GX51_04340 [Blastomyces parvus]|uniref:Uncharacterized protein n=1 Tax=Blastomyces parvus TaxID=2060905 RepID=A0A2B7X2Q0_9EURO|nr:hypothetical protein GX51_04340 [Blastomyces parvus]